MRWCLLSSALGAVVALGCSGGAQGEQARRADERAIPVELAAVERGRLDDERTFSGALDAFAELEVAAKIAGRVKAVEVDLGDEAPEGALLVTLEDDEARQAERLAQAELTVANAALLESETALETVRRELARAEQLKASALLSEQELDTVRARERTANAAHEKARGGLLRAKAQLATAKIQLGYTRIEAGPLQGGKKRVVAARHVDPGDTVAPGTPLVTTVEIDPLIAVVSVTEQEYGRLSVGQPAMLTTDAFPGRRFEASVSRIAPKFDEASRQARVELSVDNHAEVLKPGLFVRATLVLGAANDALIVPEAALTRRGERDGVFVVDESKQTVKFHPIEIGIRSRGRVEIRGEGITGRVVTLGQQLLDDGSRIVVQAEQGSHSKEPSEKSAER